MDNENIFTLTDEDGNETEYEFLSLIPYEGKDYAVMMATAEDEEDVLILSVEEENGEEFLETVVDDDILEAVFELFREKEKDNFDFI